MAIEVVTGPPFAGKAAFVRAEIERREAAGELGLVVIDYTAIYSALVPGVQSSYRDEAVAATGAARFASAAYEWAIANIGPRELSGYITTQSPRRAIAIADRLGGLDLWDVLTQPDDAAERAVLHVRSLGKRVPRAQGAAAVARCRQQGRSYYTERGELTGRARSVIQRGRGRFEKGGRVLPFDQAAFNRGLTPAGKAARQQIVEETGGEPTPADVFTRVLQNLGRRP